MYMFHIRVLRQNKWARRIRESTAERPVRCRWVPVEELAVMVVT
jgi:hypothetical protein